MNIVLIGYRGTGKSVVARRLEVVLGWESMDSDVEVERRTGKSISEIFEQQGEEAFRDSESQVIADLAKRDKIVLAVGGGAVLRKANREVLGATGKIVWLQADVQTIYERIAADQTSADRRPNLTASGGRQEIAELLQKRTPIYRQCADIAIDSVGKTPEEVAEEILSRLKLSPAPSDPV